MIGNREMFIGRVLGAPKSSTLIPVSIKVVDLMSVIAERSLTPVIIVVDGPWILVIFEVTDTLVKAIFQFLMDPGTRTGQKKKPT
jgi:hypothetical protein